MAMSEQGPIDETHHRIRPHKEVKRDIRQMKDNLNELGHQVETAEWIELGGLGAVDLDRTENLADEIVGGVPYILEDIRELPGVEDDG